MPSNALLFRAEGLRVGVLRNSHAAVLPIKLGQDYGSRHLVRLKLLAVFCGFDDRYYRNGGQR